MIAIVNDVPASGEKSESRGVCALRRVLGSTFVSFALLGGLGGCQIGSPFTDDGSPDAGGYPSLRSVPAEARSSSSIGERRQIVRTLLEERDQSRRQTTIVRRRSGLSVDVPNISADAEIRAEDIVPDVSGSGDGAFRLTPADDDSSTTYRSDSQFDDGGLDDFIRQLKRDTRTDVPLNAPAEAEEPALEEPAEDDVSTLFPEVRPLGGLREGGEPPVLLAAFAPTIAKGPLAERDVVIRLAAAEEEPGFFCRYLGWSVAWSSMCVGGADTVPQQDSDEDVGADLEQELRQAEEEESPGRSSRSQSPSSSEAGRERAERRLSEEDAAEAIEDAGRSALAPVTSSLEKLRDYMESRSSRSTDTSPSERARSNRSEAPSARPAAIDRPPKPERRPRLREDIAIEDKGERFDFVRTPRPAFKPTPDEPVILKARNELSRESKPVKRFDPPPVPLFRPSNLPADPSDLLSELKGEGAEAARQDAGDGLEEGSVALALTSDLDRKEEPAATSNILAAIPSDLDDRARAKAPVSRPQNTDPLSVSTPGPDPATASLEPTSKTAAERVAMVIMFEPETPGLPEGLGPRLVAVLEDARAQDQKVHIIGEASSNHLARRRATDVGAALVQLGATVEILEYDHDARNGVDQVRLVLRPTLSDPLARTPEPTATQQ